MGDISNRRIHAIVLTKPVVVEEEVEEGEVIRGEVVEVMGEDEAEDQGEDQAAAVEVEAEAEAQDEAEETPWGEAVPLATITVPSCNLSIP